MEHNASRVSTLPHIALSIIPKLNSRRSLPPANSRRTASPRTTVAARKCSQPTVTHQTELIMGLLDSLKSSCTKMAKEAITDAMTGGNEEGGGGAGDRAPEDSEAYAKKVADTIKADVRYVLGYGRLW